MSFCDSPVLGLTVRLQPSVLCHSMTYQLIMNQISNKSKMLVYVLYQVHCIPFYLCTFLFVIKNVTFKQKKTKRWCKIDVGSKST